MSSNTFDVYIAIPYTHDNKAIREMRYLVATAYLAELSSDGLVAFSPITHSHPLSHFDLPTTWDFWSNIDLRVLSNCEELHVLKLPGWKSSVGVTAEIVQAQKQGIPIKYIEPSSLSFMVGGLGAE